MVVAVCLDLGGTLIEASRDRDCCDYWRARGIRIAAERVRAAVFRTDLAFMGRHADLWRTGGSAFLQRYWTGVHAELGLPAPPPEETAGWGLEWRVFAEVTPVLAALRRAGLRLALVSNWDRSCREVLAQTGLVDAFDVVAVSEEVGVGKPDPAIFAWTLHRLGAAPAATIHVGDNYWDDVAGAVAAGIEPLLLHRHPEWSAPPEGGGGASILTALDALPGRIVGRLPRRSARGGSVAMA